MAQDFWPGLGNKKEQIALSLSLKEQITLFSLLVKSNESDLLLSHVLKERREQKSEEQIPNPEQSQKVWCTVSPVFSFLFKKEQSPLVKK